MMLFAIFLVNIIPTFATNFEECLKRCKSNSEIITRNDVRYEDVNYQFDIRFIIYPYGYVFPKSSKDVQKAVICAQKHDTKLAILCGKHSYEKYSYGTNNSWIIDVTYLNEVKVNKKKMIATVGAGNRLQWVTEKLWNAGKLGTTVGSCFSVGISGFAMGGGFGMTARKYGLLLDRMAGAEIVTADGKIRNVNRHKDRNLFWALRGAGGGNFGIVTKFRFRLFDASNQYIWIVKKYNWDQIREIFLKWQEFIASDVSHSIGTSFSKSGHTLNTFTVSFVINEERVDEAEDHLSSIINNFPSITESDISRGSYMDFINAYSSAFWSKGKTAQFYFKMKGYYVSKAWDENDVETFVSQAEAHPVIEFLFQMYAGAVSEPRRTSTAFVHRTSLFSAHYHFYLNVESNGTIEATRTLGKEYEQELDDFYQNLVFLGNGELYQNNVDNDLPDWFDQYYKENGRRLMDVKQQYDPENFFSFPQSIPPRFNYL